MRILQIGLVVVAGLLGILIGLVVRAPMPISDPGGDPVETAYQLSDEEFTARVRTALVTEPEILQEAIYVLESRNRNNELNELQDAITRNYSLIESAPASFVGGNPDGDITIVEFFDYECGYCRRAMPAFDAMVAEDGNIRVIYFEMPILGERSQNASLMAVAADRQGLYTEFHRAAMGADERLSQEVLMTIAVNIGLDMDQLRNDLADPEVAERVNANLNFAQAMQVSSTPTFVVAGEVVLGWNEEQLAGQLATARGN